MAANGREGNPVTARPTPAQVVRGVWRTARGGNLERARSTPPPVPAGAAVGPPDFIGVGTARSGTSWWDALIHAHPDVVRQPGVPKELHFFDRYWDGGFGVAAATDYAAFFPRPSGKVAGEWTPGYMVQFWTPPLLSAAAPSARILVLLRDPVERFRSALALTENRLSLRWSAQGAAGGAFARGLYADQLARLFAAVPRERVLVLQYERCVRDPRAELARTFDFLGLDRRPAASIQVARRVNESRSGPQLLSDEQRRTLVERYAPENQRLAALAPELDLDLWARP